MSVFFQRGRRQAVLARASFAALLTVLTPALVTAQNPFGDTGFSGQRGTFSALPYEHVDPLSGNLIVTVTDLALPGNAGLDLRVARTYNSKFHRDFEHGNTAVDEPSAVGVGWRLHFGRVLHLESNQPGQTVIETPDGGGQPLYQTRAFPEGWMSKGFVRYNRTTHTAKFPNGLVYTFGHVAESSGPRGTVRSVTAITDPFGNSLTFTYHTGPIPGAVLHITQTLGGGQQRDVHFDYRADGTLERMVYGGHEWFYDQDAAPGWGVVLRRVRHLGNSGGTAALPWEYLYANTGVGPELTTLLAPGRGQLTYTYQTVSRRASSLLQSSRVVTTRASGGYLVQPGTWTFAYNQGANLDTTVVSCPCGTTSYRYNGIGLSGDFVAWKSGTLAERTVYDGPTLLEQELLTYRRSALISSNQVPGESGVWADTAVYNALLEQRQLTRPTQTWTTTLQYNEPNFNDYGQAWRTTETGDAGTRWTDRTFQTGFVPWIANRVVGQSLRVGQETVFSSWTYDLATGFQTQATTLGVTQTSAPTAQGNVASVSDAHGHQTSFTYAWGVVSGTTTPLVTTARTINPDGSVAAETVGNAQTSLTTTYVYDAIGRLLRVRPPGWPAVNEISYEYDHGQDLWLRTARGASQTTQVFDGFGRVVTTTSFTNVKTRVDRDACGRAVFAAAPSTSATETRGVATTYDALGRTKTVTVPGAVVTATYTYANGDVTVTDAASRTTQYNYAGFGGPGERLLSVTDAAGQVTTYTYEVLNNLTDVVGPTASGPARQWRYDGRGLLMEDTQPESGRTQYFYDAAGLLTRTVDSLGRETLLSYDANHRLVLRDATGATADVALTYDPLGRVTSQVMAGGLTTAFTFDAAGRPASRTDSGTPLGQPFGSQYQYDGNDNLTRIIYPSLTQTPRQVSYTYDNENRLTGVLNNGVSFASAFHYDDSGRLDSFQTGPVVHTVTYDTRDRVQALTAGAGSPQLSLTYGYNNVSQVIGITDPRAGMSQAFQYDALDRLRVADGPWGRLEWTYDPQGNRLTEQRAGQTTAYTYHAPTQRLTNTTGGSAESFGYNAVGELTSDGQGTYTYSPAGMMLTAMRPGLSASYQYDADQARVRRDVNGTAQLTVRSVAGQVLSEFEKRGAGPTQWVRDNIYAGSRLLGAVKSTAIASPEVELTAATGSVTEGQAATITVRLRTPNQQPLAAAVSATVRTTATGTITAQPGADYTPVTQTVTFAANAPHLATATVTIPTIQDASDEPVETIHVELSASPGAVLSANTIAADVTITDDDAPPSISVGPVTVSETAGTASVPVTVSTPSAFETRVSYTTSNQTAVACTGGNAHVCDYTASSGQLVIPAGAASWTIAVPIVNNDRAEQPETFTTAISAPINASIGTSTGVVTIGDDEVRWPIDASFSAQHFPDMHSSAAESGYLRIYNPHTVAVTARVIYTFPNGSGAANQWLVPALGRVDVGLWAFPEVANKGDVSAVVQSLDLARPLVSEYVAYTAGMQAGRQTRGATPAPTWYLAEGAANSYYTETITIYNPTNGPVDLTVNFLLDGAAPIPKTYRIEEGPGRLTLNVEAEVGAIGGHGTEILARVGGTQTPANVTVERTIRWAWGNSWESASANGATAPALFWYVADGAKGAGNSYSTWVSIANPGATEAWARIFYYHDNGVSYAQDVHVPARQRKAVTTPASVPEGGFGMYIGSVDGTTFVVERTIYAQLGTDVATGTVGTAETATTTPANTWRFAEGYLGWDTWFLIMNPTLSETSSNVTLTYRRSDGTTVTQNIVAPPRRRVVVNPLSVMSGWVNFTTDVTVTSGPAVVAERAVYWLGASGWGSHVSLGRPQ